MLHKQLNMLHITTRRLRWLLPVLLLAVACNKSNEPIITVGKPVPPPPAPTHSLAQLVDSLPDCTIYKAAWTRADITAWLDSVHKGSAQPFTLFIPTDAAFTAAGITVDKVKQWSITQLDSLILYLTVPNNYTKQILSNQPGNIELNPPLKNRNLQRTLQDNGFQHYAVDFQYQLFAGVLDDALQLNGHTVAAAGRQSLDATDGTVWTIDSLVQMPQFETYQVLTTDTSFSFYMAACRYSNQSYLNNRSINNFNDTLPMQLYTSGVQIFTTLGYRRNAFTILAPVNDAFRKAGFQSISDITEYIDKSTLLTPDGKPACTNMDSILRFCQVGVGPWNGQLYANTFFTTDLLFVPSINDLIVHGGATNANDIKTDPMVTMPVHFTNDNGQVLIHRNDYPNGRAAHIIAPHDVFTLTGVIHALDNLLLPTP